MTLKGGAKFEEKLPLTSKSDMRNFVKVRNFHLDEPFLSKKIQRSYLS